MKGKTISFDISEVAGYEWEGGKFKVTLKDGTGYYIMNKSLKQFIAMTAWNIGHAGGNGLALSN